jgi:hypothetical protein
MRRATRPRARLKRDTGADRAGRFLGLKQRVNAHRAGEPMLFFYSMRVDFPAK